MQQNVDEAQKVQVIFESSGNMLSFIKKAGRLGIASAQVIVLVVLGLGLLNVGFFFAALFRTFITVVPFHWSHLAISLLVSALGIGFIAAGTYWAYRYCIMQITRFVYDHITTLVQSICVRLINFVKPHIDKTKGYVDDRQQLSKAVNFADAINTQYPRLPGFIQQALSMIFKRLPLVILINEVRADIMNDTAENAAAKLHQHIDEYVLMQVFAPSDLSWLYWLVPINIVVQGLLVWYCIS